jgi:sarcosine oxidase subunit gamma
VPNIALSPPSELECVLKPRRYGAPTDEPGVVLAPLSDLSLSSIIVRNGKIEELRLRAKERLGIELPMTPRRQIGGALSLIWTGSGRWLAATSKATPLALEQRLGEAFLGVASVTNQSDGRSIVQHSRSKGTRGSRKRRPH